MDHFHSCAGGAIAPGRSASCPRCSKPTRSPSSGTSHARAKLKRRLLRLRPVCECCEHAPSVELHHIVAMARRPDLAAEETNALMLCRRCHLLAKGKGATLRELRAHARIAGITARR